MPAREKTNQKIMKGKFIRYRLEFDELIHQGTNIRIFDCDVKEGEDVQEKAIEILELAKIVHGNILSVRRLDSNSC